MKKNLETKPLDKLEAQYNETYARYVELEKERKPLCDNLKHIEIELGKRLLVGRIMSNYEATYGKYGKNGYLKIREVTNVCPNTDGGLCYTVRAARFMEVDKDRICRDERVLGYDGEISLNVNVKTPTTLPTVFKSSAREDELNEKIKKDELLLQLLKLSLMDKNGHDVHRGSAVTFVDRNGNLERGEIVDFDIESKLFTINYPLVSKDRKTIQIPNDKFTVLLY